MSPRNTSTVHIYHTSLCLNREPSELAQNIGFPFCTLGEGGGERTWFQYRPYIDNCNRTFSWPSSSYPEK